MILQYKGFNNNWCYEEAETIVHAKVSVADVIQKYKNDFTKDKDTLSFVKGLQEVVDKFIQNETQCSNEIVYHITNPFDEMKNVDVVTLEDKNKQVTYVFENSVYLLNSRGQTVQKLA